jgi:hypothetical protein
MARKPANFYYDRWGIKWIEVGQTGLYTRATQCPTEFQKDRLAAKYNRVPLTIMGPKPVRDDKESS